MVESAENAELVPRHCETCRGAKIVWKHQPDDTCEGFPTIQTQVLKTCEECEGSGYDPK